MNAPVPAAAGEPLHLILCEGPGDLAFWTGLLFKGFGCVREHHPPRVRKTDADAGRGRKHFFRSRPGRYVEAFSVGGKDNLLPVLRGQVKKSLVRAPIAHLLLNYDTDAEAAAGGSTGEWTPENLAHELRSVREDPVVEGDGVRMRKTGGLVESRPWTCDAVGGPGVPTVQTLERLACAALCEAYPGRGDAVARWLESRPDPPAAHGHKSAAMSYMAGWRPDDGSFNFYQNLWADDRVRPFLVRLLTDAGVWAAAGRLLGE